MIAHLGEWDPLTDGVKDYCTFVGDAMRRPRDAWELEALGWEKFGWGRPAPRRLDALRR